MPLSAGTVTIADDGAVTSSGAAGALFTLLQNAASLAAARLNTTLPTGPDSVAASRGLADVANAFSSWLVTEMTTNARAIVRTTDVALQRMPASTAEDTPTKAPNADKYLVIV